MNKLFCCGTLLSMIAVLSGCAYDNDVDKKTCSDIVRVTGEPDMTKAPQFSVNGVTSGASLSVSLSVDDEVALVDLWLGGENQSGSFFIPLVTDVVTPANQVLQYNIDTTGFQAGAYYLWVDLCSDSVGACGNGSPGSGVIYSLKYRDAPNPEYVRKVYWDGAAVDRKAVDACISVPYFYVN